MKTITVSLLGWLFALLVPLVALAQVGIGTTTPGSTLDVRGSRADNYTRVTTTTYTLTATDSYVSYNGTAAGTITLPAAGSGISPYASNFKGRRYTIKNSTTSQLLTITPSGSEMIDGNASISLGIGQSVELISTGLSGATTTWEIMSYANAATTSCVPGYMMATMTQPTQNVTAPVDVQFTAVAQNGLSVNPSTGVFTLVAGNTYLLQAGLRGASYSTTNTGFLFRWVDENNNFLPGNEGLTFSNQYAPGPNSQQPIATAVYTPTNTVNVKVRIVVLQSGTGQLVVNSYAYIQQLNLCLGR